MGVPEGKSGDSRGLAEGRAKSVARGLDGGLWVGRWSRGLESRGLERCSPGSHESRSRRAGGADGPAMNARRRPEGLHLLLPGRRPESQDRRWLHHDRRKADRLVQHGPDLCRWLHEEGWDGDLHRLRPTCVLTGPVGWSSEVPSVLHRVYSWPSTNTYELARPFKSRPVIQALTRKPRSKPTIDAACDTK